MRRTSVAAAFALLAALPVLYPPSDGEYERFWTSRTSPVVLPLTDERDAFTFAVFGDRTGGPPEGIEVLEQAVEDVNLFGPDLVMTVGDLVQGYNETPRWLDEWREYDGVMARLDCPWYPVAGNHDVYWRGDGARPPGEHEADYEAHFGPLWYAVRHKSAVFVALYSDEGDPRTGEKTFSKPGAQRMSDAQFAWLRETLERAGDAEHVFVFLHHPRWLGGDYGDDWNRVHGLLAAAGNVKAVFAGHIHHMRYDGARDGIEYFTLATVGGDQSAVVPEAGYLHHYLLVTVRDTGLDVVSLPVGTADDPRRITGAVADEARALASRLAPVFDGALRLGADLSAEGELSATLSNPTSRPVEITLVPSSADGRWTVSPEHAHFVLEPGARERVGIVAERSAAPLDAAFAVPAITVLADILAERWRVSLPPRTALLPLDASGLPAPAQPGEESVLLLDGDDDCLSIASAALLVPDGPLTVEAWLRADAFRDRQGFVAKTEGSEFGLFVSQGRVDWSVHLDGRYASARSDGPVLTVETWHHVAGVFDGAELRAYVDGELVARSDGSGARRPNGLPLIVGADVGRDGTANSPFPGAIDEVRVSTVARYTEDTFEPARRLEPDADAALLLHMDGELGPWVHDASPGSAHPLRVGGARVGPPPE